MKNRITLFDFVFFAFGFPISWFSWFSHSGSFIWIFCSNSVMSCLISSLETCLFPFEKKEKKNFFHMKLKFINWNFYFSYLNNNRANSFMNNIISNWTFDIFVKKFVNLFQNTLCARNLRQTICKMSLLLNTRSQWNSMTQFFNQWFTLAFLDLKIIIIKKLLSLITFFFFFFYLFQKTLQ